MESSETNPFFRADTLFGVCQALGDDLGIHPNWLRVPLASAILFTPAGAVGTYFGLGLLVLISRLLFPSRKVEAPAELAQPTLVAETPSLAQDTRELAEAA